MFTKIFYNPAENRLRAGFRILIITSLLIASGVTLNSFTVSSLAFTVGLAIIVLLALWVAANFLDHRPFRDYGFTLNAEWFRDLMAGALIAGISMGVIFIILHSFGWITITESSFDVRPELFNYLLFMMGVSVWEEGFFRSYLIPNLKEGLKISWISNTWALILAVILSSLLFAAGHMTNPGASHLAALNIFIAGAILAYPFIATGSIALSTGLHLSWNYFQSAVFGLPVSGGQFDHGILQSDIIGPQIFTGGEFGPEGGIIGFIGLMVMIIFIHIYVILTKRSLQSSC